jgi:hypothetical protein
MNAYGKCVLTGAALIGSYAVLVRALGMMNRPSDVSLYTGLALVFGLACLLPFGLRTIWRRRI